MTRRLPQAETLARALEARTTPGQLFTPGERGAVRCVACAHRCVIAINANGACGVRLNRDGVLRVPHGYIARSYVRPVETNTIFHLCPGALALTFGMYGCDLRCPYCHNHRISQALRDGSDDEAPRECSAEALVLEAVEAGCSVICAAYNEPMIAAEWVRSVFTCAKRHGLYTAVVSDGHSTREALTFLRDVTDVFRVDLKAASESGYRELGGRLEPVLESIGVARELGYWVEVVTLVVPGLNHDPPSIRGLARALHAIDPNLPWHLNAFVPRYRWGERPAPDPSFLTIAAGMAYATGLRFVYVGNVPGFSELSHTRCPRCATPVVRRENYSTLESTLSDGACPACHEQIPGIWTSSPMRSA